MIERGTDVHNSHQYRIPVIGKLMKEFNRSVGEIGFVQAHKKIMIGIGRNNFLIEGKTKQLKEILTNKPVVVVCNHPFYGEIFASIAALEPRNDLYLIGTAEYLGLGQNIAKHIDPIFMTKQMSSEKQKFVVWLGHKLHLDPHLPSEEAHRKNTESIKTAAEQVKQGELVVMFPEGIQAKKPMRWFNGIGYLLVEIGEDADATLVNIYVSHVGSCDLLRFVPGVKKFFPPITVVFSTPQDIAGILNKSLDPKVITKNLKDDYDRWAKSLVSISKRG